LAVIDAVLVTFMALGQNQDDGEYLTTLTRRRIVSFLYFFLCKQHLLMSGSITAQRLTLTYVIVHLCMAVRNVQIGLSGEKDSWFLVHLSNSLLFRFVLGLCFPTEFGKVIVCNLMVLIATIYRYACHHASLVNSIISSRHQDLLVPLPAFAVTEFLNLGVLLAIIYGAERAIEVVVKVNLETEGMKHAVDTLLRGLCDGVLQLDPDLRIASSDLHLSQLLVGEKASGTCELLGQEFVQHIATDSDREHFLEFVSKSMLPMGTPTPQSQAPVALHVKMRDFAGTDLPVQLLYACLPRMDEKPCHLLGVREAARLPREACIAAPPQVDICMPARQESQSGEARLPSRSKSKEKDSPHVYFNCLHPDLDILKCSASWTTLCGEGEPRVSDWIEPSLFPEFVRWLQKRVNSAVSADSWSRKKSKETFCKVVGRDGQGNKHHRNLTVTLLDPEKAYFKEENVYIAILALELMPRQSSKRSTSSRSTSSLPSSLPTVPEELLEQFSDAGPSLLRLPVTGLRLRKR